MTGNFVSLYKTRKKGETSILKLKCGWLSGELNILVIDGKTAWSGKFSTKEIESFCEALGITRDEYITECQQAFSGGKAAENFLFAVENDRFVWRKELEANTRVIFGSIKLSPVPLLQALEEFVDFAFESVERCRQEANDAKNKMGYFETERTTLLQKLEEYTQNKKEMENILYSKFLYILNSKKERVAILERELSDLKSKRQHTANETEILKCDTSIVTEPSSRETRKTNKKPYQRRARQSPPSMTANTKLPVFSDISVENNDTQTAQPSTSKQLKNNRNVRQKGQQQAKMNSRVENRTTSHKKEESDKCMSKAFVEQLCEPNVLENMDSTQHQPIFVRSASPIASTSNSVITRDQFVPDEKGKCISLQSHADQKSPSSVKRGVNARVPEEIKDDAGSVHSSEAEDKTARKISEVICPIDLVSQKVNAQSDVCVNKVNKLTISENSKKVATSPAKQYKEFEIISPLDMLVQPKSLTQSLSNKDTFCLPINDSLKRPMQSMNMQYNSSDEFSTEGTNARQEAVACNSNTVIINDVNTNSRINTTDATSVTVPSINHTKSITEGESCHYDSETDVDEPEEVCKLSVKHRSVNSISDDSSHSSLAESDNLEVKCDEIHQLEQKNGIENSPNDSQDTDCTPEEVPMAALPKRMRRSDRINKSVPKINKSVNHFAKLSRMQNKSQNVSQNVCSVLYEQETQIVDTQKLLDDLG